MWWNNVLRGGAVIVLLVPLASSVGCTGQLSQTTLPTQQTTLPTQQVNNLKMVALTYLNYVHDHQNGPTTVDEFITYAQPRLPAPAQGIDNMKSGKYVFFMGVNTDQNPDQRGETVLGYETEVPGSGGLVAMCDGSVRQMTAAEFAAAKKPAGAKLSTP